MERELLIMANLGFDQCLAASLLIENINGIEGLEDFNVLTDGLLYYNNLYQYGDGLFNENLDNDHEDDDGEEIDPRPDFVTVCFCNEVDLAKTVSQLPRKPNVVFLVGYNEQMISKDIICLFKPESLVFFTMEFCTTKAVAQIIQKNYKDHYYNLRIAAANIFCEEYQNINSVPKLLITKKMRQEAQIIVDDYMDAWTVAYNIFMNDIVNLNRFHHEFLNRLIFGGPNDFINSLNSVNKEMEIETEKLRHKIKHLGHGIFLLRAGSQRFFKIDIIQEMYEKGCPFFAIEYIHNLEKKVIAIDFRCHTYYENGPFKKNKLIEQN
jgi:hypothetical protein